jgi:hypothetical protein
MDYSDRSNKSNNILKLLVNDHQSELKGYGITNLYIEMSLYYHQIKRYLDNFPKDQLLILRYEDLQLNTPLFMTKMLKFLELDFNSNMDYSLVYNQTYLPKNIFISKLRNYKHIFPKRIRSVVKDYKSIFFKRIIIREIPQEAENYIKEMTNSDWLKTQKLLKNYNGIRN